MRPKRQANPGRQPGPIFIAGCGRSGTTLLRTLLNAHPDVFIPTECLFLADYIRAGSRLPSALAAWLFYREPQLRTWYQGPHYPLAEPGHAVEAVHKHEMTRVGAARWGQKTPRFVRHIPAFQRVFPGARWVLVYRDPRAVVASMLRSRRHTYSVEKAVERWRRDNAPVVEHLAGSGQGRAEYVYVLKYEDFVAQPEHYWAEVQSFCGLSPSSLEEIAENAAPETYRRSRFENNAVRAGVFPRSDSLDAWRQQLTRRQVAFIESRCDDYMHAMGYSPVSGNSEPAGVGKLSEPLSRLKDLGIIFQYLRNWPEYLFWTVLRKAVFAAFKPLEMLRRWRAS